MHHLNVSRLAAAVILAATLGASTSAKDTYDLRDNMDSADLTKVRASVEVNGTLNTRADGQDQQHSLAVSALMEYAENRLPATRDGRAALRLDDKAEATIRIDQGTHQPQLAAGRRLMAVHVSADKARVFCPIAPLTRDELDLIDIPGNSAVLPLLLPGKSVEMGADWPVAADTLAMLLGIDSVSSTDVQCKLMQVAAAQGRAGRTAKIRLAGHVDGSINGAATEIALRGDLDYDLKARRISRLEIEIDETRAIGPVGPGLKVNCRVQLTAATLASSPQLTDDRTIRLAREPSATALLLTCELADGYRFHHSRQWHVVDQRQSVTALRLMDGGEMLAQCNIAPAKADAARPKTLAAYEQEVRKALDQRFEKQVSSREFTTKTGLQAFAVVAEGQAQDVPVRWAHYLLTHPSSKQIGVAFTLEPKHAGRFGMAGEELVNTLRMDGQGAVTQGATAPTTAVKKSPATKQPSPAASRVPQRKPRGGR
jgi:hypothetical protein